MKAIQLLVLLMVMAIASPVFASTVSFEATSIAELSVDQDMKKKPKKKKEKKPKKKKEKKPKKAKKKSQDESDE